MASHLPPPSPLRVFSVIIKSMKGYDKMARTLQYGNLRVVCAVYANFPESGGKGKGLLNC
eukprot:1392261-Amorphochlora_amoeboformis.AAC.1